MKILDKIKSILKYPQIILLLLDKKRIITLPDKKYLEYQYKRIFNKNLDLENPKTFNEKLQWLKLNDRNPKYVKMVDKYEAKKYVQDIIGKEYIIPTLNVYNSFEEIDFDELPKQFVMKCTHDSGGLIICKDKSKFNYKKAKKKINTCLKRNYFYYWREWPYKNIKPRIIIEKFMEEEKNEDLTDYKFMCFNGKVHYSFVCLNRNSESGLNVDFYDINWNKMNFERHYKNSNVILEKPKNYALMIELAEKLSKNIKFLRVDFYEINGKVYFGELTFYPGSGFEEFTPEEWDKKLGDLIVL